MTRIQFPFVCSAGFERQLFGTLYGTAAGGVCRAQTVVLAAPESTSVECTPAGVVLGFLRCMRGEPVCLDEDAARLVALRAGATVFAIGYSSSTDNSMKAWTLDREVSIKTMSRKMKDLAHLSNI